MPKNPDAILKLAIALAVVLAGAGIGFYYGIFLPSQDVGRQSRELARRQVEDATESKALAEHARREQAAQTEYQGCVALAEATYRQRWTASCQAQNEADTAAFEDCADNLFASERGCRAKHPIRPARDCALPSVTAQDYGQARDARKAECAGRLQAAQSEMRQPRPR